jgi:hypothetical protein
VDPFDRTTNALQGRRSKEGGCVSPEEARGTRTVAGGLFGVTSAALLGNVLSYLVLLIAARSLASPDYGALVTLLNLVLIGSVPTFALQTVAARHTVADTGYALRETAILVGVSLGALLVLLAPVLSAFLRLDGIAGPVLVGLALPGLALQGLCQGVWQGREDFHKLAATTLGGLVGRSAPPLIALVLGASTTVTIAALTAGVTVAALLSAATIPELRRGGALRLRAIQPVLLETAHAAHGYGVFLLLSVCDLLLARHALTTPEAAVYAAGSVLTKAALWLPQSVANVLFASLADSRRHRAVLMRGLAGLAIISVVLIAATLVLGKLAATVVGGAKYPALGSQAWLFVMLGCFLATIQFTLVAGLAVRRVHVAGLIWLCVAAEIVVILGITGASTVHAVVLCAVTVTAVGVVCAVLSSLWASRPRTGIEHAPLTEMAD